MALVCERRSDAFITVISRGDAHERMVQYKTIPVKPETHDRLTQYKLGKDTYDDVVNGLMDMVPLEEFIAKHVAQARGLDTDEDDA